VLTVIVTGTVVAEEVKATIDGLKLQALSDGKLEHIDEVRSAEPVSPFCAEKVSVVDPDCPGLVTTIIAGFAASKKEAPTLTGIAAEVEP
jgi:hypothetical protein